MDELSSSQVSADQFGSQSNREYVEWSKKPAATQENNNKIGQKIMVQKVWNIITPEYLQSLYKSMPQPVQATVDAQDSHAKNQMYSDMFFVHF